MSRKDDILTKLKSAKQDLQRFGVSKMGLFGSYSRDEQTDASDIDLLVDFEPGRESYDNLMAVCDFFERLFINYKIDVVTKNGLSPHIGPRILKEVNYV